MTSRAFCRKTEPMELMRAHSIHAEHHQRKQDRIEREEHLDEALERAGPEPLARTLLAGLLVSSPPSCIVVSNARVSSAAV